MQTSFNIVRELWKRDPEPWTLKASAKDTASILLDTQSGSSGKAIKKRRREKNPLEEQGCAYMHLKRANTQAWWRKINAGKKPPNAEQKAFLESVIQRCEAEANELPKLHTRARKSTILSEPLRSCLFGIPGAGISCVIVDITIAVIV